MLRDHARILVLGTSGAGKTTFARALSERLGIPHVELDVLHWGPGWQSRDDFSEQTARAAEEPQWIIDGNYAVVRDYIWPRATAAVWLNYSFPVVFGRAVSRTVRRIVTQEQIFAGNRETWSKMLFDRDGIPWWVIRTHGKRRREFRSLLADWHGDGREVFELRRPGEAEWLLSECDRRNS